MTSSRHISIIYWAEQLDTSVEVRLWRVLMIAIVRLHHSPAKLFQIWWSFQKNKAWHLLFLGYLVLSSSPRWNRSPGWAGQDFNLWASQELHIHYLSQYWLSRQKNRSGKWSVPAVVCKADLRVIIIISGSINYFSLHEKVIPVVAWNTSCLVHVILGSFYVKM